MITLGWACEECCNRDPQLKEGWRSTCKAYPDGIDLKMLECDPRELPECNNGYRYEPRVPK